MLINKGHFQHQEYKKDDESPKEEPEQKETEKPEVIEEQVEEVKEEEPVDKDQTEETELPPLISTDGDDDLLVCFCYGVMVFMFVIFGLV
jgi:hypothetical protein